MFALQTDRLLLRKLIAADLDELVALDADPEVMRYINDGEATPRTEYETNLLPRMLAWASDDPVGFYAAIHEGARALAGFAVDQLKSPWIDGCARPDNLASIAVLRKCGLSYVDTRMHPRAPIEVAFYRAAPGAVVRGAIARNTSRVRSQGSKPCAP